MHGLGFDDLELFARIAALGTLSAVARERDVPVSQVSRSLARIEKTCGARLIHRSTHALALTAEGEDTLVAKPIGLLGRALYAAPMYLASAGMPTHPEDLRRHRLVTNSAATQLNQWPFVVDGKTLILPADGHWRCNDTGLVASMVLQGLGVGRLSTIVAEPLVNQALLVPVLPGFVDPEPITIYAVFAGARLRLPKIKACVDYWAEWFGRHPSA